MAHLTWNRVEDQRFEAGVSRAVFYPQSGPGVPWHGLTAITEKPTAAELRPEYQDGVKTYAWVMPQEYAATLEAYTYPDEFELYNGMAEYAEGVMVDDQQRRPFNIVYRTSIGDGHDITCSSYKIHLLYNALALPSAHAHTSLSELPEPVVFSWELTATPVILPNHRPSAHFIVDSRKTGPKALEHLERILYGSHETGDPRMPTAAQLYDHFNDWHVLYPSSSTYPSPTTYPGAP